MQQLTGLDASMLYMETAQTPNHVAAIYTYDPSTAPGGSVSFDDIVDNVQRRLGMSPTFRRKMVRVPFGLDHPYWMEDADFDLEYHVRPVALPSPGSWRQLCDTLAELYAIPLDLRRPPWEMYVLEGLGDGVDGIPHGGFATLIKVHHAAVDGMAGVELVTALHDREPGDDTAAGRRRVATRAPARDSRAHAARLAQQPPQADARRPCRRQAGAGDDPRPGRDPTRHAAGASWTAAEDAVQHLGVGTSLDRRHPRSRSRTSSGSEAPCPDRRSTTRR